MSEPPPELPDEPGADALERFFAAEEAAIADDGFSKRIVEKARDEISWRRRIVYGAGMAGFGVALASIIDMAPHLPKLTGWVDGLSTALFARAPLQESARPLRPLTHLVTGSPAMNRRSLITISLTALLMATPPNAGPPSPSKP